MLPILSDIPQITEKQHTTTLVEYKNKFIKKDYSRPDDKKIILVGLSPEIKNLFKRYQIQTFSHTVQVKIASFLEQGDLIGLANEILKNTEPLVGEEYDTLINTLYKNAKTTSTIKGML